MLNVFDGVGEDLIGVVVVCAKEILLTIEGHDGEGTDHICVQLTSLPKQKILLASCSISVIVVDIGNLAYCVTFRTSCTGAKKSNRDHN